MTTTINSIMRKQLETIEGTASIQQAAKKMKEIMSSPLITISSRSSPSEAADMMLQHNVRHLLVVDNDNVNKPIGIITPLDFTRHQEYVANEDREAIQKMLE